MGKMDEKLYLQDMYNDTYYPKFLVDKIKVLIKEVVYYLEKDEHSIENIQAQFDTMTIGINNLEKEFEENDSEIETVARESIGQTVSFIIKYFNINLDTETAIRERDW